MTSKKQDQSGTSESGFVHSYLLYLLAASSEAASEQFHKSVRENGLRVPEWRVLASLTDGDGVMITQLAMFALVEQSRMTRIIDQMHKRGLVERRSDAGDRRRVRIYLTKQGRDLADRMVAEARAHETKLLGILEDTDAERIKPVLQSLLKSLQAPSV